MTARAALVLFLLAASACEARLSLGSGCTLDSECPAPLACRNGRCRVECATARDCARGSICVPAEGGLAACQLPPEVEACGSSAECGGRLECLAGRCTAACTTEGDCLPGARCDVLAGCVECVLDGDCPAGLRCASGHVCSAECTSDADCTGGLSCVASRCTIADGGLRDAGPAFVPDHCEDAERIDFGGTSVSLERSAAGWTRDAATCHSDVSYVDAFFSFELTERSIVFVTADGRVPTIGWIDDCAARLARCEGVTCGAAYATIGGPLEPGVHTFVVSSEPGGSVRLFLQRFAVPADASVATLTSGATDVAVELRGGGPSACGPAGPSAWLYGIGCAEGTVSIALCSDEAPLTSRVATGGMPWLECLAEPAPCAAPAVRPIAYTGGALLVHLVADSAAPSVAARVGVSAF